MHVNLFNLQFPSVQTFNINCFLHAPFQDLPNLITRERIVDKGKVCGEPVFICTQTPLPVWEESHRNQLPCICAARHSKTLKS